MRRLAVVFVLIFTVLGGLGMTPNQRVVLFYNPCNAPTASALLCREGAGLAIRGTIGGVQLAIKDTTTPANNRNNIDINDATSPVVNATTSPKLVLQTSGQYAWAAHNLFLNSDSPATQNVTLISGLTYTMSVTGSGSLAGSSGASGTATAGSPATFTATGATGTFTVTGSLATIQLNRGTVPTAYLATTSAASFAAAEQWDPTLGKYAVLSEPQATNLLTNSQAFDNTAWLKSATGSATTPAIVADQGTAPDGTSSADLVTINRSSATDASFLAQSVITSGYNAGSLFVKAYSAGDIGKQFAFWQFNGSSVINVSLITLSSSWQRGGPLNLVTLGTSGTKEVVSFGYLGSSNGGGTQTGQVQALIWQAQAETGTVATSPIPTAAATVTRAADADQILESTFPWNGGVGTLKINGTAYTPVTGGSGASAYLDISGTMAAHSLTELNQLTWIP